ncbi:hypothetical protein [Acinetobacter sp. NIPH 2100]|uniref:hypothetical protein n=1 Tax=Acinetobacter sp. NIPH 2100 TaxID=1217708 RepID=UPI0002D12E53|nr:hypothetical protein [Acinetobacter sp. NIPH 2100]ENX41160.1 hypothetical protein F887_01556 [Acinetobacter sp. NIPH 2100]
MKKILILLISAVVSGSVYSADDIFKKDKSLLILDNDAPHYEIESSEQVDFFESLKQQEQDRINQRNYDLEQQQQIQSNTSNMSPHDKSQYFLEHRHFDALNAQGHEQQFNSMLKAKNRGLISEKDYQQKIVKQSPMPSGQRSNQLRFSIPIGE